MKGAEPFADDQIDTVTIAASMGETFGARIVHRLMATWRDLFMRNANLILERDVLRAELRQAQEFGREVRAAACLPDTTDKATVLKNVARDRQATERLLALIEALPRCDYRHVARCENAATFHGGDGVINWCDAHGHRLPEYPYATALRRALVWMNGGARG